MQKQCDLCGEVLSENKLIEYWAIYKKWCFEQITNRYPRHYETVKDDKNGLCMRVTAWHEERNMVPTFDGFIDWLNHHRI